MSAGQTLKSAIAGRVVVGTAQKFGSERTNGGNGQFCSAGCGSLGRDIYGRPANQDTLNVSDNSCSQYTEYDVRRRIANENIERPYIPICRVGRPGDGMGVGRDVNPRDLYGVDPGRGHFYKEYNNLRNMPPFANPSGRDAPVHAPYIYDGMSMDATQRLLRL